MRRLALCCLFVIGVSGLIAKQPPPPVVPESLNWDTDYVWIIEAENGDYVLWGACEGYGIADTEYVVRMYAIDDFQEQHHLGPRGGGETNGWWWGVNYDGSVKWNDFSGTVVKNTAYWKEINKRGSALVHYTLSTVNNGNETIKVNDAKVLYLMP